MDTNKQYQSLYDLGYQEIKDPSLLDRTAFHLNAIVLDIRLRPFCRNNRDWSRPELEKRLAGDYLHVPELGNVNYRDWNAPVQIQDIEEGMKILKHILQYRRVILMCACRLRDNCHRIVVVQRVCDELGVVSTPLSAARCRNLIKQQPMLIPDITT